MCKNQTTQDYISNMETKTRTSILTSTIDLEYKLYYFTHITNFDEDQTPFECDIMSVCKKDNLCRKISVP